jgi:hypothetical protein
VVHRQCTLAPAHAAFPPPPPSPSVCRYRLAFGTSDKLQGGALVAAFHTARDMMARMKKAEAAASAGGTGRAAT